MKNPEIKKRKYYYIIIAFLIIFFVLLFFISFDNDNLRDCILCYCFFYGLILSLIILEIIYYNNHFYNNIKIYLLVASIFSFSIFCKVISYSDFFYYLKKNIIHFSKFWKIIINLFSLYFLLIFLILKEIKKSKDKKYHFYICRKTFNIDKFLFIYILFFISIFIEDCTIKDYYDQNLCNRIFVCFNFIFFILLLNISNFVFYEINSLKEINNIQNIIDNFKEDELGNIKNLNNFNISYSKDNLKNKNNSNIINLHNNDKFLYRKKVEDLPCIKIFLLLTFFWISDESQKLFGLIILLPFLELLNYLSDFFYLEINKIKYKFNDFDERSLDEITNSLRNSNCKEDKNKKNLYIYYFIFYLFTQDMFIISNQASFALMKNSFGFDIDKTQQSKSLYILTFLRPFFGNVSFYRYSLIILGFYLDKGIYERNGNIKDFSLNFTLRKILLNIRLDIDILLVFYQMLIKVNDKLLIELFIYFMINFSLFIFDFIGFCLIILNRKIFK